MGRKTCMLIGLFVVMLLSAACGANQGKVFTPPQSLLSNKLNAEQLTTTTPQIVVPRQVVSPTAKAAPSPTATVAPSPTTNPTVATIPTTAPPTQPTPTNIPGSGSGAAPYGPPPAMTTEEIQLTQQLFALINSDRAARGLYPFVWNATLAGGARLHSWNMIHCGFSHTCPDGLDQCTRIANEGFAGFTDCGENIALAGPYPAPWQGVYNVQESMINEPPTGWHRIHLTSTTLHRIGVGIVVDSKGWIWFTEDMVS